MLFDTTAPLVTQTNLITLYSRKWNEEPLQIQCTYTFGSGFVFFRRRLHGIENYKWETVFVRCLITKSEVCGDL